MSASLVGSEMCIRDRVMAGSTRAKRACTPPQARAESGGVRSRGVSHQRACLLYTSDAADDM
eukprot:5198084-Alexandrium_andersonii.AAC.1